MTLEEAVKITRNFLEDGETSEQVGDAIQKILELVESAREEDNLVLRK